MTAQIEISHSHEKGQGRFSASLGDGLYAEMTYRYKSEHVIVIDHTYVPPAFEGRGIALALVRSGIEYARENSLRIVPQCAYVAVQFKRHKGWHDLLETEL